MAVTRVQKEAILKDLVEKMGAAQSIMFAHYIGLTVAEVAAFRNQLRDAKAEMKVAKKTLIAMAAKQAGLPEIKEEMLDGPVTLILSSIDPLSGAQVAYKFGKTHSQVELIGGVFEGKVVNKAQALELAKIPSRDQLLTIFAYMIRSPLSSFARGMKQIAEKQTEPAAPEPAAPTPEAEPAPAPAEVPTPAEVPPPTEPTADAPASEPSNPQA